MVALVKRKRPISTTRWCIWLYFSKSWYGYARVRAGGTGISTLVVTNGKYGGIIIIVLLPYIGWCDTRTNKKKATIFDDAVVYLGVFY